MRCHILWQEVHINWLDYRLLPRLFFNSGKISIRYSEMSWWFINIKSTSGASKIVRNISCCTPFISMIWKGMGCVGGCILLIVLSFKFLVICVYRGCCVIYLLCLLLFVRRLVDLIKLYEVRLSLVFVFFFGSILWVIIMIVRNLCGLFLHKM